MPKVHKYPAGESPKDRFNEAVKGTHIYWQELVSKLKDYPQLTADDVTLSFKRVRGQTKVWQNYEDGHKNYTDAHMLQRAIDDALGIKARQDKKPQKDFEGRVQDKLESYRTTSIGMTAHDEEIVERICWAWVRLEDISEEIRVSTTSDSAKKALADEYKIHQTSIKAWEESLDITRKERVKKTGGMDVPTFFQEVYDKTGTYVQDKRGEFLRKLEEANNLDTVRTYAKSCLFLDYEVIDKFMATIKRLSA